MQIYFPTNQSKPSKSNKLKMSDLMAMEKVIIPKQFTKNTSTDFNNKNLELVDNRKNFMFGEFQLMAIKPSKKVIITRSTSSKKSSRRRTTPKPPI